MTRARGFRFWESFLLAERGPLLRYGVALALALASLAGARFLYAADVPGATSLALATVVLSGIYGGLGPALLDAVLTSLGLEYMTEPELGLLDSWDSVLRLVLHGAVGYLIADIAASLRTAYRTVRAEYMEAERARRAREDVLNIVSHDLRSPLSVIKVTTHALRIPAADPTRAPDRGALLGAVERAADQMQRIIDDLLDAARIEKGQFRIEPSGHDLPPILDDAVSSVRALAEARRITLELEGEGGRIECDRARLLQVLGNLLHNAVKFSPEGGRVELAVAHSGDGVRITVRDYGPGMDAELVAGLFQRYWQAADTAHRGTGLGLFISGSIVKAHGGRITVESAPGAGTSFTVWLPSRTPSAGNHPGQGGSKPVP